MCDVENGLMKIFGTITNEREYNLFIQIKEYIHLSKDCTCQKLTDDDISRLG